MSFPSKVSPFACQLAQNLLLAYGIQLRIRSTIRYAIPLLMLLFAVYLFKVGPNISSSGFYNGLIVSWTFVIFLLSNNLLWINPVQTSFVYALALPYNPRGIGTPWLVKNVPSFPNFYGNNPPDRFTFVVRQLVVFIWTYLALDLVFFSDANRPLHEREKLFGPGKEFQFPRNVEELVTRVVGAQMAWFFGARLIIGSLSRLFSIIAVASGLSSPEQWPPFFGRMRDAYTVRNFWG
jgi:hypothetical protein